MSEGARARSGEESVEEEDSGKTEVADALANAPESPQDDGADASIHGAAQSSSFSQGQFQSPFFQDSIHEGTLSFLWYSRS
ncbi:hypothetical protein O181_123260 [Austropuccinia psidii MF-1]|uniref:Uncharacterized protein n=1 Tax=Austropuccinia psidii MF-1 TaxID=1389203 RepID=A0A9Q3KKU4_9BASI|nr:hypothetical protein [Austropuccinia psidii MF-1]